MNIIQSENLKEVIEHLMRLRTLEQEYDVICKTKCDLTFKSMKFYILETFRDCKKPTVYEIQVDFDKIMKWLEIKDLHLTVFAFVKKSYTSHISNDSIKEFEDEIREFQETFCGDIILSLEDFL